MANSELARGMADLEKLKDVSVPKYEGFLETLENSASYIKEKSLQLKNALGVTIEHRDIIVENLLKLTFLYVGIFVVQVLVLPLLIFWVLVKIIHSLFLTTTIVSTVVSDNTD